ncbi:MAG: zinc ribbon domain-containing protein [Candidatus Helarchaeota archaeon]
MRNLIYLIQKKDLRLKRPKIPKAPAQFSIYNFSMDRNGIIKLPIIKNNKIKKSNFIVRRFRYESNKYSKMPYMSPTVYRNGQAFIQIPYKIDRTNPTRTIPIHSILGIDINSGKHFVVGALISIKSLKSKKIKIKETIFVKNTLKKMKKKGSEIYRIIGRIITLCKNNNSAIAIEKLNFSFTPSWSSWPYRKFSKMLIARAEENGIKIVKVNPQYTSITHYKCGKIGKKEESNLLICKNCKETINIHLNAAINIAKLFKIT